MTLPTCQGEYSRIFPICLLAHHLKGKSRRRRGSGPGREKASRFRYLPSFFLPPKISGTFTSENRFLQSESKVLVHSITGESFVPNMEPLPWSSFSSVVPSQSSLGSGAEASGLACGPCDAEAGDSAGRGPPRALWPDIPLLGPGPFLGINGFFLAPSTSTRT